MKTFGQTFKITAEEKDFVLRHRAAAAVSAEQKAVVARLRKLFKKMGLKCKYKSSSGKASYVEARIPFSDFQSGTKFSAEIRNIAINTSYGGDFKRDKNNPRAGNIQSNSIALGVDEWEQVLDHYGF